MKFPVKLIVPEIDVCSDITLPYIVDDDGIVIVCKCTVENGRVLVEALNNYTSRTDCSQSPRPKGRGFSGFPVKCGAACVNACEMVRNLAKQRNALMTAAKALQQHGFFEQSSCASDEQNAAMQTMREAIAQVEGGAV